MLPVWLSLWGGGRVHWVQVVGAFEGAGPAECRRWSSGRVFRCFCPLYRFVFGALPLKYAFIRILRRFLARFPLLDVGLYCSGALRGLCGFCVREWLGGFMA